MSCVTEAGIKVLEEPHTVTAQQLPFQLMTLRVPLTIRVASLQSSVWSRPSPTMWVSPFLACAVGGGAAGAAATTMAQAASGPATVVQFTARPLFRRVKLLE